MGRKVYNILVVGYYYRKNYGDDLLLAVAQKLFGGKYTPSDYNIKMKYVSSEHIKPIPTIAHDLVVWADKVVLFGGEVLNSYFLDRLIYLKNYAIYELKKNIPFYAMGVSINEDYLAVMSKLDLFETIVFRNLGDYTQSLPRLTNLYSKSLPDPVFFIKPTKRSGNYFPRGKGREYLYNVGFFLSQTVGPSDAYIQSIVAIIRKWFMVKARVFLMTMCNNTHSATENDILINSTIYNELNYFEKEHCVFLDNPQVITDYMAELDFAICWRFHSHIFCIQHQIPFLSISNTPKVVNILRDNQLEILHYTEKPILPGIDMLLEKRQEIRRQLEQVHNTNREKAGDYKRWDIFLFRERSLPRFYIDISNPRLFYNLERHFNQMVLDTAEQKATALLYLITGKIKTHYHWGLVEKIKNGATLETLRKDILWLIEEEIKTGAPSFYYKMATLLEIQNIIFPHKDNQFLNIHYTDQNDMRGVHRAGWQYVIDNIEQQLASFHHGAVLCDLYVDRTFHWNLETNQMLGIIPYTRDWIGFIHHTCNTSYTNYNTVELFNKPDFIKSLTYCKGLIVLSVYLRKQVAIIINRLGYNIPVFSLFHPTEFLEGDAKLFNYNDFINATDKKVVQVGAWYRDIEAIFKLTMGQNALNMRRFALNGPNMDSYYSNKISQNQISRDRLVRGFSTVRNRVYCLERPVQIINNLDCDQYDQLFKTSVIFIRLIDASAVNTIIEAIVRNTPILVNPIEPVIEYLGKDYPFYYTTFDEATRKLNDPVIIRKAYFYLKKMDKTQLKIDTFIQGLRRLKIRQLLTK